MSDSRTQKCDRIVFFVDRQKFVTDRRKLTVREILVDYANEDPNSTILVEKRGDQLVKHENLDEVICMRSGLRFVVFHTAPTPVS